MVEESKSQNRRLPIILGIAALLVAAVVIVVIVLVLLRPSAETAAIDVDKLMPDDSIMFATLNPHLDQAKNFEVIEKAWGDNPIIKMGLTEMLGSMNEGGLDYKADVEPWLGDAVAFSMGPNVLTALSDNIDKTFDEIAGSLGGESVQPPAMGAIPAIPEFILAVATKDKDASDAFLGKLRAKAEQEGTTWQETEYIGIKIVYSEPGSEGDVGAAYATVDDFVVLTAGGLESMQAVIDGRDGASLAENETYKDVIAKLPSDQIVYSYVDMAAFMDAVLEVAGPEMGAIPALPGELLDPKQLKAVKGVGFSVGLEPNGLRVDLAAVYDKDALPAILGESQANPNKAAERVPASTLFFLSANGLDNAVQMGLDAIKASATEMGDLDEQMQMITAMLGVSVEELIEMLSGEFAIAIGHDPAGIGGDPSIPVGASVLIEAKDASKFQKLLNSFSTLLALSLGSEMEFPKETINDVEVTSISDPADGNMLVGWGVGKGFFATGTSRELLEAAFGAGGEKLADTATYKAAIGPLPDENTGVFFINLGGLFKVVEQVVDPGERESFEQARPFLGPIKAISAAMEPFDPDKDSGSGTLFILIGGE